MTLTSATVQKGVMKNTQNVMSIENQKLENTDTILFHKENEQGTTITS